MVASLEDRINKAKKGNAAKIGKSGKPGKSGKGVLAKIPSGPRGGITKQHTRRGSNSGPSNIDGKWTHDLFSKSNPGGAKKKAGEGPSLESRISKVPTRISTSVAKSLASNRLFAALHGGALTALEREKAAKTADSIGASIRGISKEAKKEQPKMGRGFSIRGSAGPFAVHASNFAPGTTASDIRAAMEGIGKIVGCAVTSASPTVIAEIVFEKKEDADTCIQMYNNKKADGYLLHMFLKNSPSIPLQKSSASASNPPKGPSQSSGRGGRPRGDIYTPPPKQDANKLFVDGTRGFQPPKLYSDALVQKGRGFNR